MLAACLLTGFILASGCAGTTTEPTTAEYIEDSAITAKVKTALLNDNTAPGTTIKVETLKSVVQLGGSVDTPAQKERAGEISRSIAGVREVVNNIAVK